MFMNNRHAYLHSGRPRHTGNASWQTASMLELSITFVTQTGFRVQDLGFRVWGLGFRGPEELSCCSSSRAHMTVVRKCFMAKRPFFAKSYLSFAGPSRTFAEPILHPY